MHTELPVAFESEGARLQGLLVRPEPCTGRMPCVVMAHGTSATVAMVAIEYARAFARAGIAALVYDHRSFGRSGGEPRSEINPLVQCRGYVDALNWASAQAGIDPARLALWGDSYSAGEAVVVAACDPRVKAVVGQCPVFGAAPLGAPPVEADFVALRDRLREGDVSGTKETTTGPLPVVAADPWSTPSLLTPIQAFRWFIDYGGRPGSGWVNRVTRVLPSGPVAYSPLLCAAWVQASVLLMVAPGDEMPHANPKVARQAYEQMPGNKHWEEIAGGHFGLLYFPGPLFNEAVRTQSGFLVQRL